MYIAEISPARWRGRLVGCFQFNVVFGILLAYFSNYLIGTMGFGSAEWRWKLGISALPALLFLAMLFGIPESPRWLVKQGRTNEAGDVLRLTGEENADQELREIVESIDAEHVKGDALFSAKYRVPIFLAVTIGMRSEEHTSELQSRLHLVCRLLLEKKNKDLRRPPSRDRVCSDRRDVAHSETRRATHLHPPADRCRVRSQDEQHLRALRAHIARAV